MKTLKRIRKFKVPNRLAIAAAVLLAVSTLAGVAQPVNPNLGSAMLANDQPAMLSQPAETRSASPGKVKKQRGFKISLLLLRLR